MADSISSEQCKCQTELFKCKTYYKTEQCKCKTELFKC